MTEKEARIAVRGAGRKLLEEGLVARTWGNVSIRLNKTDIIITPSGRTYEELNPEDMVRVNYVTHKYEGSIKPSSEYKLHTEIYKTRKEIHAVMHTHQMNASTVATAQREIPPILDDQTQILGPSVRVAPYALPNSKKIVKGSIIALKVRNAALMANHGAVCIGRDIDEVFVCCQVLEKAAKAFIEAEFLGGAKSIKKFEAWIMHKYYLLKYSKEANKKR